MSAGTRIDEIAPKIFRISTPVPPEAMPGGFTFNQFLLVDDEPLLFHTGPRKMFPLTREAVASVIDPSRLRWISFSHFEADECGALNEWLAVAPDAQPGAEPPAITESAALVWEPSEAMRKEFPYAPIHGAAALLDKLAATEPEVLACMHGASYRGDGAALLQRLGAALNGSSRTEFGASTDQGSTNASANVSLEA